MTQQWRADAQAKISPSFRHHQRVTKRGGGERENLFFSDDHNFFLVFPKRIAAERERRKMKVPFRYSRIYEGRRKKMSEGERNSASLVYGTFFFLGPAAKVTNSKKYKCCTFHCFGKKMSTNHFSA